MTDLPWPPPLFQSFESYNHELEYAIHLHPDFGNWIAEKRRFYEDSFTWNTEFWMTIDQLKKQYVSERQKEILEKHARRHTLLKRQKHSPSFSSYDEDKRMYKKQMKAYEEQHVKYVHSYRNGVEVIECIRDRRYEKDMPKKPRSVEYEDAIEKNSVDVAKLHASTTVTVE
jgi:hypothetical protein